MKQYLEILSDVLWNGVHSPDRTGTGTISLPCTYFQHQLVENNGVITNFPLLTTKFVGLRVVFEELMWKLSGSTNIRPLLEHNVHIWTEWPFVKWLKAKGIEVEMWSDETKTEYSDDWKATMQAFEQLVLLKDGFAEEWGSVGKCYGYQMHYQNQLNEAVRMINEEPESRRIIINLWNPKDLNDMILPPCDMLYEFHANEPGYLSLTSYQRSTDLVLGAPYNIAQDTMFLLLMAKTTNRIPKTITHIMANSHIYKNLVGLAETQIERTPLDLPSVNVKTKHSNILDYKWSDIELLNYKHLGKLKGAVSI